MYLLGSRGGQMIVRRGVKIEELELRAADRRAVSCLKACCSLPYQQAWRQIAQFVECLASCAAREGHSFEENTARNSFLHPPLYLLDSGDFCGVARGPSLGPSLLGRLASPYFFFSSFGYTRRPIKEREIINGRITSRVGGSKFISDIFLCSRSNLNPYHFHGPANIH